MGISVCMIVKNEERFLENCLSSIRDLADEIILVDTGSSDRTKEIASKFTSKIYDFVWEDDFSKARNFAISKANCEWILSIDADEVISKEDIEKIKKVADEEMDAVYFIIRDYTNNVGSIGWKSSAGDVYEESRVAAGYSETPVLKFFRNRRDYKFEGRVHEVVENSIKRLGGKIFMTDIVIHHYGPLRTNEELKEKKDKYAELLRERLDEGDFGKGEEFYVYYEIARELIMKGELTGAKEYLKKSLELNSEYVPALTIFGGIYLTEKNLDEAERLLKRALILNGNNGDAHSNLGIVYSERKEYNKAIRKFERAIEINPRSADGYYNLGLVYLKTGKKDKAASLFDKAIELNPEYGKKLQR
jgi:tetratricopeptide (TPR) repeat protein